MALAGAGGELDGGGIYNIDGGREGLGVRSWTFMGHISGQKCCYSLRTISTPFRGDDPPSKRQSFVWRVQAATCERQVACYARI